MYKRILKSPVISKPNRVQRKVKALSTDPNPAIAKKKGLAYTP